MKYPILAILLFVTTTAGSIDSCQENHRAGADQELATGLGALLERFDKCPGYRLLYLCRAPSSFTSRQRFRLSLFVKDELKPKSFELLCIYLRKQPARLLRDLCREIDDRREVNSPANLRLRKKLSRYGVPKEQLEERMSELSWDGTEKMLVALHGLFRFGGRKSKVWSFLDNELTLQLREGVFESRSAIENTEQTLDKLIQLDFQLQ